ncbi:transcriptional regulator family: Fungal Specific TF [Penicillium nucicola]|uniref:transcriptional regulator family: Fungal Specific TF n=1 Tax=Penicillium nucicola TaxID=1850975 RepID=UPI0025457A59|nr:transcriptional regulator family: Fungal Specific TF [Penicillium nucicola]KAJ5775471.1 transcriptional regulator family: Fungal Specific TF [Penicillium nucicola]
MRGDALCACANCNDASLECRRSRAKRPARPELSSVKTLIGTDRDSTPGEGVLILEPAVSQPNEYAEGTSYRLAAWFNDLHCSTLESPSSLHSKFRGHDDPPLKKPRLDAASTIGASRSPCGTRPITLTPEDSTHHAEQARAVIQGELDGNQSMDRERQWILRSALDFVSSMTQARASKSDETIPEVSRGHQNVTELIPPSPELLYMLLQEPTVVARSSNFIQWPDHISDKTLEKMAATILGSDHQDQLFYQYSLCIYVKAIFHLYPKPRAYKNPRINDQFLKSTKAYEASALYALHHLNFLNPPSLPFIQSLVSAAFLMQYLGSMSQCWILNSYAARLIAALGYHEIGDLHENSGLDEEISSSVIWCYYLDRTLSTLLYRPLSLPEPQMPPAKMISARPSLPHIPLVRILLDLAQVQGELLSCHKNADTRQIIANHSKLQDRMEVIHSNLQLVSLSSRSRDSAPGLISSDWIAGDFCYYAILVDILRSRLKFAFSPLTHRECLSYSRRSLRALHHLQKNLADTPGFSDPYPSFLSWTVLLYPLSPFFVLFCNIIGELDTGDYSLIQEITQSLSQFASSPYIGKLHKLLDTLQNVCTPLIQAKERLGSKAKVAALYPSMSEARGGQLNPLHTFADGSSCTESVIDPTPQLQLPTGGNYPSDDELMWQLFNSQLSLEWFESEMFSQEAHFNVS